MSISFELTPEQKKWQKLAREFAEKEAAPRAVEIDERDELPRNLLKKMASPPNSFKRASLSNPISPMPATTWHGAGPGRKKSRTLAKIDF